MKRLVVTGMGMVSPLGCDVAHAWKRLLAGHSGIVGLPQTMVEGIAAKVGGVVPHFSTHYPTGFDPDQATEPKERRKMDRFILFSLVAAKQALEQAGGMPRLSAPRNPAGLAAFRRSRSPVSSPTWWPVQFRSSMDSKGRSAPR